MKPDIRKYESLAKSIPDILYDMGQDEAMEDQVRRWIWNLQLEMNMPTATASYETGVNGVPGLVIQNCMVEKPCNFVRLNRMLICAPNYNGDCTQCREGFAGSAEENLNAVYARQQYWEDGYPLAGVNYGGIFASFQDSDFRYVEDIWGYKFPKYLEHFEVKLYYEGFAYDESGYPYIDVRHHELFVQHCLLKHIERHRATGSKKYSINDARETERKRNKMAARARAHRFADGLTIDAMNQIAARMNNPRATTNNPWSLSYQNSNTFWSATPDSIWYGY